MLLKIASTLLCILFSASLFAETHEVGQQNKSFTKSTLKIKKGDTVRFTNQDPFFHNVFSLSDAKLFDLGSYPAGEFRDVKFEEEGVVEVECAIHPSMTMEIIVE